MFLMTWPTELAAPFPFSIIVGLGLIAGRLLLRRTMVGRPSTCRYKGLRKYASAGPLESIDPSSSVSGCGGLSLMRRTSACCASISRLLSSSSASFLSRSETPSYQATICLSGSMGKHFRGSILGSISPLTGSLMSHFSTASIKKLECSSGPSNTWIVCHIIHPSVLRAGTVGSVKAVE